MFWLALQGAPVIVQLYDKPTPTTSFGDVILGALGVAGALTVVAAVAGVVFAAVLIQWHRRRRPEDDHLPSVRPY